MQWSEMTGRERFIAALVITGMILSCFMLGIGTTIVWHLL